MEEGLIVDVAAISNSPTHSVEICMIFAVVSSCTMCKAIKLLAKDNIDKLEKRTCVVNKP